MWRKNVVVAPLLEAALILTVALTGWLTHQPLVFTSLGPTAFEMIETPKRPSARPYHTLAGHTIAVLAAFAALLRAALSTTILMSSGALQSWKYGGWIMVAVALMVLAGEAVRRWRTKGAPDPG